MYTNIPKPTGTSYTKLNRDNVDIPLYGSAIYGVNTYGQINNYTNISKPFIPGFIHIIKKGMGTAMFAPLTQPKDITVNTEISPYTNISKPT